MEYLTPPVIYLDKTDFDDNGNLKSINSDKPIFIMIQAVFCFHCTKAKPWYQEFAMNNKDRVICCSIQGDAEYPEAKNMESIIKKICPDFMGFPSYVVLHKGEYIQYKEGRKTEDLQRFLDKLIKKR